jgi:hypothetical protein
LFHQAILKRQQITCTYRGRYREICPYILGHKAGNETALVYQFGGQSSRLLPPQGEWRCLSLNAVENAEVRNGKWYGDAEHRQVQRCVEDVYVDVNLAVPNQPGRR